MADTLYLSLWYPNLRLAAIPDKLTEVLGAFAAHGGEPRVYSATVWPVNWSESPVFQQIYGRRASAAPGRTAPETCRAPNPKSPSKRPLNCSTTTTPTSSRSAGACGSSNRGGGLDARWVRAPRLVRVTGFGPLFDDAAYEQDGHIRVDFGSDTPFLEEDLELDSVAARHVEENVRQLVKLTAAIEKDSGATARLLWSELGESLAQRLAARLAAVLGSGN